ncbi:single-stranded DNA-binding protein [Microbispora catharanthi]|uniref:Single-stranded DNA-binding protein n=1 Tax=Microbispora catharanthi TaxID=1712871 RepID=A0A5N6C4Q7_9ACTN|nr:single-stranded DNA-binding protein [Microbispora catharanthi]KAB8187400.1 single-stranded DNA-binding protein [Microbispora catharanthi]
MHRNEVVLAGRLSMVPAHRELPSGALLTQWRLAVRRPGGRSGHQRSDAIECATLDDGVRDMLAGWQLDDLVEVEGALRRRWWRGGSRYEIEVRTARRVEPAAPRGRPRRRTPHADDGTAAETGQAGDAGEIAPARATDEGDDAVSAEPGDEVISQWRRSA